MSDWWVQFTDRDVGPFVQFIRYALCGGVASAVDIAVFFLLSWRILPALRANDPVARLLRLGVRAVTEEQRSRRFVINTAIAFFFSNLTAYVLNILWVFEPGRFPWWVEMLMFYAVSGLSMALGTALGWAMIRYLHLSTTASYIGKFIAALLVNFAGRKFVIFKG